MSLYLIPSYQLAELIRPNTSFQVTTGTVPAGKNNRIIVRDVGGEVNPKWLHDTYLVSVQVHADRYDTGFQEAIVARDSILTLSSIEQTDIIYRRAVITNGINALGLDENGIHRFTMTFEVTAEPKPSNLSNREPLG